MNNAQLIVFAYATFGIWATALGGVVGYRVIEHDDPMYTFLRDVSGDGSTLVLELYGAMPGIAVDQGNGLETALQLDDPSAGVWYGGVSYNGGVVAVNATWPFGAMNWSGGGVMEIPGYVMDGVSADYTYTGAISGNGLVNAMHSDGVGGSRALLYQSGAYSDLGLLDQTALFTLSVTGMDYDGRVMSLNRMVHTQPGENRDDGGLQAWVWSESGFVEIPDLALGGDRVESNARGVSSDGRTVFGNAYGVSFHEDTDVVIEYGPTRSWIYRDGELIDIGDGTFDIVIASDISDDGETLLVRAGSKDDGIESYLWTREGGFVSIADLLAQDGIQISRYSTIFNSISGDGRVLTANSYTQGYGFTSYAVTIPSPGALLMLGGGVLALSGRRR